MKIISTSSSETLREWDLRQVNELDSRFFIYNYKNHGYEGSGFAVWDMPDNKYGYTYLGHCSCNGPVEDLNSIPYTLHQLEQIAMKNEYAKEVMELLELRNA